MKLLLVLRAITQQCFAATSGGYIREEENNQYSLNGDPSGWPELHGPVEDMPGQMLLSMERNPSDSSFSTRFWGYMPPSYEWVSSTLSRRTFPWQASHIKGLFSVHLARDIRILFRPELIFWTFATSSLSNLFL